MLCLFQPTEAQRAAGLRSQNTGMNFTRAERFPGTRGVKWRGATQRTRFQACLRRERCGSHDPYRFPLEVNNVSGVAELVIVWVRCVLLNCCFCFAVMSLRSNWGEDDEEEEFRERRRAQEVSAQSRTQNKRSHFIRCFHRAHLMQFPLSSSSSPSYPPSPSGTACSLQNAMCALTGGHHPPPRPAFTERRHPCPRFSRLGYCSC